jgi:hypothetical protein
MATKPEDYAFLGWQGWGLEHPKRWELNRVKGDRRAAYLSLDDGERVRLEINWKPVRRKLALEKLADRQAFDLERNAKRHRLDIRIERRRRVGRPRGFEFETFVWNADISACEMVARCKDCGRVILIRVIGERDKPPMREAERVFSSLVCYGGKDRERWGTFGLDVSVPARFELERSSLNAGLCRLVFNDRRAELVVSRASLGRAILERMKMLAWFEGLDARATSPFQVKWDESPLGGHIGYKGTGELRSAQKLLAFFRGNRRFAARCFYCEPSDKILAVSADGVGDVSGLVEDVSERLVCHGGK